MTGQAEGELAEAPVADREPLLPRLFRVRYLRRETENVFTVHLEPQDGGPVAPFQPGQFNMLYTFGVGEVPISIAGGSSGVLVHTIRTVGPVTHAMAAWKRGSAVGVRGPFGSAWPMQGAEGKDVVIVAGGIGLAPLREALHRILSRRHRFGQVSLLYGTRSPADLLYSRELERMAARLDLDVAITVDRAGPDWHGHVGVVTTLINGITFNPANAIAMLCGPEVMMRFTVRELMRHGLPEASIFLSLERNMECAIGLCGHCQFGPHFICREGAVFRYDRVAPWLAIPEL